MKDERQETVIRNGRNPRCVFKEALRVILLSMFDVDGRMRSEGA